MSELPLILDEAGLSDPAILPQRVATMPFRGLQELLMDVSEVLSPDHATAPQTKPPSLGFDFLASSSIRGDSFCRACARDKVRSLARYAALYCDRIILPFPGLDPVPRDSHHWRAGITERLFFLQELRPVLEANIVQLFRPFHFCAEHWSIYSRTTAPIRRRAEKLYRERLKDFEVIYRPGDREWGPSIELTGPEEYVEHGRLITEFGKAPEWAPKRLNEIHGGPGKRLSATTLQKTGIVKRFFDFLAQDLIFHQMVGQQHNVKYITDLTGEAQFFAGGDEKDDRKSAIAAVVARLAHSVPLFHDLPVRTILKIRSQETDSFDLYRHALCNIVEDYVKPGQLVSERVAVDLYNDVLRPALLKLKIEASAKKRENRVKMATRLGVPTALISLGIVSGLVPNDISQLLKAVGISSLITQAADALTSLRKNPPELRNQDLYFLLRLSEQT
jgi:hypothetical protein